MWSTPAHGTCREWCRWNRVRVRGSRGGRAARRRRSRNRPSGVKYMLYGSSTGIGLPGLAGARVDRGQAVADVVRDVERLQVVGGNDVLRQGSDREAVDDLERARVDHLHEAVARGNVDARQRGPGGRGEHAGAVVRVHVDAPRRRRPARRRRAVAGGAPPGRASRASRRCRPGHVRPRAGSRPSTPAATRSERATRSEPRDADAAGHADRPRRSRRVGVSSDAPRPPMTYASPPIAAAAACVVGAGSRPSSLTLPAGRLTE